MNKEQIIDRLSFIAAQAHSAEDIKSRLFGFLSDLCNEGITIGETYSNRMFPVELRREIIIRDHFTCAYCNRVGSVDCDPDGDSWSVDHVIPYSKGGLTCIDNGALSCLRCNSEKGDLTPAQYMRRLRVRLNDSASPSPSRGARVSWTNWVAEYAANNPSILQSPPLGIRSLARAMSIKDTGSEENANRYTGIASETCQYLRENLAHFSK